MSNWVDFLPLFILALAFWFVFVRPMRKRQREFAALQQSLVVGQRVVLGSGIYGTLVSLTDTEAELEIAPGVAVSVVRQAIARTVADEHAPDTPGLDSNEITGGLGTDR